LVLNNDEIKNLFLNDAVCITITLEESICNLGETINNSEKIFNRIMQFFEEIKLVRELKSYNIIKKGLQS